MPRLADGGPGLALSPDGEKLAVAGGGRLRLFDVARREEIARAPLEGERVDVGFTATRGAARIVTLAQGADATQARAFTLKLDPSGQLELIGPARIAAIAAERVLVTSDGGEQPRVLALGPTAIAVDPIALRTPVQFATEAPEDRILVAARDQIECWDPVFRRALFRVHLPVQKPRQAGFASRRRLLWVATANQLDVFRFSDGRLQLRIELGRRFVAAAGHPESPRLLVATADDGGAASLTEFDLVQQDRRPVPLPPGAASFLVLEGAQPLLVTADLAGTLAWIPLELASSGEVALIEPNLAPREDAGSSSWRAKLVGGEEGAERRSGERRTPATPAREPAAATPPARPGPQPIEAESSGPPWRDALLAWGYSIFDGGPAAPPPEDSRSRLAAVVRRFGLDERAATTLGLLYVDWLRGGGRRGVAASLLERAARAADPADDGHASWGEALGQGALARSGLAAAHWGRLRLAPTVGRFLDGAAPRVEIVATPAAVSSQPALDAARWRVALPDVEDRHAAVEIARRLGRDVALIELGSLARATRETLEARLHGAVPLACGDKPALTEAVDALPPGLVLLGYRGYCPEELANLPVFEIE